MTLGGKYIPPIGLALIVGLLLFALSGRSHGPNGGKITVRCPDYAAVTPHEGRVRIERIRGAGTTCAEVRRVLALWYATDLRKTGQLLDGYRCGIDPPQSVNLRSPTGGCKRSAAAGVQFDIRFGSQR